MMTPLSPPSCQEASNLSSSTPSENTAINRHEEISRECQQCITYLKNALNQSGRTQSLLRALGVMHPISDTSTNNNSDEHTKMYSPTSDRRGVVLQLNSEHALQSPVSIDPEKQRPRVSLQRRFTNVASRMVGYDTASTVDVLTTSPKNASAEAQQSAVVKQEMPKETTITIECIKCGSDTKAEAGARAYVRGPIPLSIILCSNRLSSQSEISEVLIHELTHVYDVFIRNMDLRQCHSLAYSEVRAARDAECHNSLTTFTRNICSKEKASVATKNMFPEEGRRCVCDVFDDAITDMAPLGLTKQACNISARDDNGSDVGVSTGMASIPREARPSER